MKWRDQRPSLMTADEARQRVTELARELDAACEVWVAQAHYAYEGGELLGVGADSTTGKRIADEAHHGAPGSYASEQPPLEWDKDNGDGWHTAKVHSEWYTVRPCKVESGG